MPKKFTKIRGNVQVSSLLSQRKIIFSAGLNGVLMEEQFVKLVFASKSTTVLLVYLLNFFCLSDTY